MKIYEAMRKLEDESVVLKNNEGELFRRYNKDNILRIYSDSTKPTPNSLSTTRDNDAFIAQHLHDEFEIVPQWYDSIQFPILCKVREQGWTGYKIVAFKSRSGNMLQTHFGESYIIRYGIEIEPLSKDECLETFYPSMQ